MCVYITNSSLAQYGDITDFGWGLWAGITRFSLGLYDASNTTTDPLSIADSLWGHFAKILKGNVQLPAVAIG